MGEPLTQRLLSEDWLVCPPRIFSRLPLACPRSSGASFAAPDPVPRSESHSVLLWLQGSAAPCSSPGEVVAGWYSAICETTYCQHVYGCICFLFVCFVLSGLHRHHPHHKHACNKVIPLTGSMYVSNSFQLRSRAAFAGV